MVFARLTLFPQPLPVSRLCLSRLAPAPALATPSADTEPRGTQSHECVEKCPWPKPVESPLPHRKREDDLGVQASNDELHPDQDHRHLGTSTNITFNCVQPFFLVPQGFTLPSQVSSSKSHRKFIPSRKSSLGFSLGEQSSKCHEFISYVSL